MCEVPRGATEILCRDWMDQTAGRMVTKIDSRTDQAFVRRRWWEPAYKPPPGSRQSVCGAILSPTYHMGARLTCLSDSSDDQREDLKDGTVGKPAGDASTLGVASSSR
jgi:hypothetical protein